VDIEPLHFVTAPGCVAPWELIYLGVEEESVKVAPVPVMWARMVTNEKYGSSAMGVTPLIAAV
jgi:hypothetical protein